MARSAVRALLQQAHEVATSAHDLSGVADEIQGCLRGLEQASELPPANGVRETRQQGSQASAVMCHDSAQTACSSTDASAQVKPLVEDESSQASVVLADNSSSTERPVFRQLGENTNTR